MAGPSNVDCPACDRCTGCKDCWGCVDCVDCVACKDCIDCFGCRRCAGVVGGDGLSDVHYPGEGVEAAMRKLSLP